MRKYGIENFQIEQIDKASTLEELGTLEREYIKKFDSTNENKGYNLTAGGERHQYDGNSQAKLTVSDVINIRTIYNQRTMTVKSCWEKYYSFMSYSGFQKVWDGITWIGIMDEVYTQENKNYYHHCTALKGEQNGNANFTDNEIVEIRKYYVDHTLKETFEKFHKENQSLASFNSAVTKNYKHLPYYSKVKKQWVLNNKVVDFNYNPVSTISVSGE